MTLAFLGWCWDKRDPGDRVGRPRTCGAPEPELAFSPEPVPVRWRGATSLYALEIASPDTVELQAELSERLVAAGLYEPEKRPFWPHITVARVRKEKGERGATARWRSRRRRCRRACLASSVASGSLSTVRKPGRRVRSTPRWRNLSCPRTAADEVIEEMAEPKKSLMEAAAKDAKAKDAALEAAVTQIEREFGAGSLMRLGDQSAVPIEAIPTGALSLDLALGIGGVPPRPDRRDLRPGVLG